MQDTALNINTIATDRERVLHGCWVICSSRLIAFVAVWFWPGLGVAAILYCTHMMIHDSLLLAVLLRLFLVALLLLLMVIAMRGLLLLLILRITICLNSSMSQIVSLSLRMSKGLSSSHLRRLLWRARVRRRRLLWVMDFINGMVLGLRWLHLLLMEMTLILKSRLSAQFVIFIADKRAKDRQRATQGGSDS